MSTPFFGVLKFKKLDTQAPAPTKAHTADAGTDLCSLNYMEFAPGEIRKVHTGISFEFPKHTYGKIFDRSSMAVEGWRVGAGVIDCNFAGECVVVLQNMTRSMMKIEPGQRVAQLVVMPVYETTLEEVQDIAEVGRGKNGFGSSGR